MVALIFLVLGFQLAIFVVRVVERPGVQEAEATTDSLRCPVKPGMTKGKPGMTGTSEAAGGVRRSAASAASGGREGGPWTIAGRSGRSGRSPVNTKASRTPEPRSERRLRA